MNTVMVFGVLKDIKEGEFRVICTPMEAATIVAQGHTVYVQKDAGKQGALFGPESMLTINGGTGKFVGGFAGTP